MGGFDSMLSAKNAENKLVFEFHIAGKLRKKYQVSDALFASDGRMVFSNPLVIRQLAYQMNQHRPPTKHVYPGELNAAGLLDEAFHILLRQYEEKINPRAIEKAHHYVIRKLGVEPLRRLLLDFTLQFPPMDVYQGRKTATGWIGETTGRLNNNVIALEELLMLEMANLNPATLKFRDLFDRSYLENQLAIDSLMYNLEEFFQNQPPFGPDQTDILTLLKSPMLAAPDNIYAQLEFVLKYWKAYLPEQFIMRLLKGKDLLKEDFHPQGIGGGEKTLAPRYKGQIARELVIGKSGFDIGSESPKDYEENKAFTTDHHWMPRVVMIAKNTSVWLDQLSNWHQREISRLDQIPDEELDRLANWNINGLWLIGIWERSSASRRIKHITGFSDAVSSAYSLFDYQIARSLGGEEAYQNLNHRALQRGIRLASDMVPNHTGIYSKWIIENPDYFIQTPVSPFPAYRFTGENLSENPDIEIRIEDGYYSRTDAAVVFQRIDRRNDDIRYLYHGNDGTNMPWNDTAQLDILKSEVREAVIQMIFKVARRFSIIRFDAAMTLAKKHFARLWYPRPGTGGDIPSRADYSMTQEEFDTLFPVEFWREVVDRINAELPDTLLLAEAFWLMEGYFVRTLGMHRVYNSAFMHMLKNEENEKFRDLITNTLEFEPEILKRYVNFMSNPDEETAIRQFGSGDKYFGVCVMMSTLPGLPMFAHGQIEGFNEKYGMEYQRAYYKEMPQQWHIDRHEKEIFPLLGKRYLFSEVEHFNFFDSIDEYGNVNESVMAFTNRNGDERVLVLYNNRYETAAGYINWSCQKLYPNEKIQSKNLAGLLCLSSDLSQFYVVTEHISGLEYLISGAEISEKGFYWSLRGFEYRIFWKFREVYDQTGIYTRLYKNHRGQGLISIDQAINKLEFESIYSHFKQIFDPAIFDLLIKGMKEPGYPLNLDDLTFGLLDKYKGFVSCIISHFSLNKDPEIASNEFLAYMQTVHNAYHLSNKYFGKNIRNSKNKDASGLKSIPLPGTKGAYRRGLLLITAIYAQKALATLTNGCAWQSSCLKLLQLEFPMGEVLKTNGLSDSDIENDLLLLEIINKSGTQVFDPDCALADQNQILCRKPEDSDFVISNPVVMANLLTDNLVQKFLRVNNYNDTRFYSKEQFEELAEWLFTISLFEYFYSSNKNASVMAEDKVISVINSGLQNLAYLTKVSEDCRYQFDELVLRIRNPA
ncbi:MAG TPA: alpha-amylase family glycosyl hydrolase [Bacteroidales bacterium]|nr:alpha-amylase family glycosyl hydrolase [Bacteroidales bacterium]